MPFGAVGCFLSSSSSGPGSGASSTTGSGEGSTGSGSRAGAVGSWSAGTTSSTASNESGESDGFGDGFGSGCSTDSSASVVSSVDHHFFTLEKKPICSVPGWFEIVTMAIWPVIHGQGGSYPGLPVKAMPRGVGCWALSYPALNMEGRVFAGRGDVFGQVPAFGANRFPAQAGQPDSPGDRLFTVAIVDQHPS